MPTTSNCIDELRDALNRARGPYLSAVQISPKLYNVGPAGHEMSLAELGRMAAELKIGSVLVIYDLAAPPEVPQHQGETPPPAWIFIPKSWRRPDNGEGKAPAAAAW